MINVKVTTDEYYRTRYVHPSGASFAWGDDLTVQLIVPFTRKQYEAFSRACGYTPTPTMGTACTIEWYPVKRTPELDEALYTALGDAYTYVWALMGRVEYEQDDLLDVFAKRESGIAAAMTYFEGTGPVETAPDSTADQLMWDTSKAQPLKGPYDYLTLTKTPLK